MTIEHGLRQRLAAVVGARSDAASVDPGAPPALRVRGAGPGWTVSERRIALDDIDLQIVGRGTPDPLTLAHLGLRGSAPAAWEDILFLDTETTGLSGGTGTYVFLLGTANISEGELVVRQHLLRDLSAEREFVAAFAADLDRYRACASYNGKCFDLPLLRSRIVLAIRGELAVDESHLDLLHPARRLWRGRFGSTTLRQLEESVLDDPRDDDIPGSLIPECFFRWVRSGDERSIAPVLAHNERDLVSLVRITDRVARAVVLARSGSAPDHAPAALALGRIFERHGELETAACCYESAYVEGDSETRVAAALPYAKALERRGDGDRAISLIEILLDLGQGRPSWRARAEARVRRLRARGRRRRG